MHSVLIRDTEYSNTLYLIRKMELLDYLETIITEERKQRFIEVLRYRSKHFTVAVEDVYQLHNTSAVMRSCEVFGIQELNIIEQRFGKSIDKQIAMGAQKWVDVYQYDSTRACISALRSQGYRIIATTPHEDSSSLDTFSLDQKAAIFFGKEKEGLSEQVLKNADGFLTIPMYGFTESLNVSVSAAIILRHLRARLHQSDICWRLSQKELTDLRLKWIKKCIKNVDEIIEHYYKDQSHTYDKQ